METQLVHDSSQWSSAAFIPAKLVMSRISRIFRDSLSCKVNFIKNEFRSTRICFYLKTSMLFPSVFTKSFSLFTCRYQAISVWKRIIFCPYCWFVAEVTAAMLVDNSWCFSLAWELNFVFFRAHSTKNLYCLSYNMAALSRDFNPVEVPSNHGTILPLPQDDCKHGILAYSRPSEVLFIDLCLIILVFTNLRA